MVVLTPPLHRLSIARPVYRQFIMHTIFNLSLLSLSLFLIPTSSQQPPQQIQNPSTKPSKMPRKLTEIAYLPIPTSIDLESGDTREKWRSTLAIPSSQPGFLALYWGRQIENPNIVQGIIGKSSFRPLLTENRARILKQSELTTNRRMGRYLLSRYLSRLQRPRNLHRSHKDLRKQRTQHRESAPTHRHPIPLRRRPRR